MTARQPDPDFADYGPWALVLGASEGVGSAFAEAIAQRGINVVLVARRQPVLAQVADDIEQRFAVDSRVLTMDLSLPNAMQQLTDAVDDLDIGLVVNCAGGDPVHDEFLNRDIASDEAMLFRNCTLLMRVCHYFGNQMVARGRGGLIILSSGAAVAGAPGLATYAGSKAFDLLFAESLWSELQPKGVDVLCLMLADTDTPTLRRIMVKRGKIASTEQAPKGATPAAQVAEEGLRYLRRGPTRVVSLKLRIGARVLGALSRNSATAIMTAAAKKIMGQAP